MNNDKPEGLRVTDITSRDTHIDIENKVNRHDNDSFATYKSKSSPLDGAMVNLRNVALDDPPADVLESEQ